MTPEHKALVEALTRKAETDGLLSVEDIRSVAESLSAQCAQPQAGEALPKDTRRFKSLSTVDDDVASPQPANPAQVTELIADLEQAVLDFEDASSSTYNRSKTELQRAHAALTAAIGAGGQAVAQLPYNMLLAERDNFIVGKGLWGEFVASLSHPPQPDERVVEATHRHKKRGAEYVLLGIGKMQVECWVEQVLPLDGPASTNSVDMREVAIYRSINDGSLWVRPREEFEDGRFEALAQEGRS